MPLRSTLVASAAPQFHARASPAVTLGRLRNRSARLFSAVRSPFRLEQSRSLVLLLGSDPLTRPAAPRGPPRALDSTAHALVLGLPRRLLQGFLAAAFENEVPQHLGVSNRTHPKARSFAVPWRWQRPASQRRRAHRQWLASPAARASLRGASPRCVPRRSGRDRSVPSGGVPASASAAVRRGPRAAERPIAKPGACPLRLREMEPSPDCPPMMAYLYSAPLVFVDEAGEPRPVPELEYQAEQQRVLETLKEMHLAVRWRAYVATTHNFLAAVSLCHVLHFTGHGEDGNVMFEDEHGKGLLKSRQQIRDLFSGAPSKPQLVFVSACHSESVAQAFVASGIPHVIAVSQQDKVLDQASLMFAHQFYMHIFRGQPVEAAYTAAKQLVISEIGSKEGQKFKLLGEGDHTQRIFTRLMPGDLIVETRPQPPSQCHVVAEFFGGRAKETQEVVQLLQVGQQGYLGCRLVCIVGPRGIGKTQVALRACAYKRERYSFDKICFVEMAEIEYTPQSLLRRLVASIGVSCPADASVWDVVEAIRNYTDCTESHSVLLLLDGCDRWLQPPHDEMFLDLIRKLNQRVAKLYVVLTHDVIDDRLPAPHVVEIGPLQQYDAAVLFTKRCPRPLNRWELYIDQDDAMYSDPLRAFAASRFMELMGGNPKVIERVALSCVARDLLSDLTDFEENVIPRIVQEVANRTQPPPPRVSAPVALTSPTSYHAAAVEARSMGIELSTYLETRWMDCARKARQDHVLQLTPDGEEVIPAAYVSGELLSFYRSRMGEEASRRPLTTENIQFLWSTAQWGGRFKIPALNGNKICKTAFMSFFNWFAGELRLLRQTRMWTTVGAGGEPLIQGFITREDAEQKLRGRPAGTFLLRVSSQMTPALVVSCLNPTPVHTLIEEGVDGVGFRARFGAEGEVQAFPSLGTMLLSVEYLRTLYPDNPKDLVLFNHDAVVG